MNYTINNKPVIIGIDHGYGNIKTAHTCFRTGVSAYDKEPTFKSDMLIFEDRYYIIGDEHKEFTADKMTDPDYYILTLAAVARELNIRGMTEANVFLAVGLPLTWVSEQKDAFKAYLLRNKEAAFSFRGKDYRVTFAGAAVFPQGFSAVADRLREFKGVNMLCDIGNGTMNIMYINNGKLMQRLGVAVDDTVIETVLRFGEADIGKQYLDAIRESASEYVAGIMRRLREHEYNPELMKLYVAGGGSCLIKNFAEYDPTRVTINGDICATARGYELLAQRSLGGV